MDYNIDVVVDADYLKRQMIFLECYRNSTEKIFPLSSVSADCRKIRYIFILHDVTYSYLVFYKLYRLPKSFVFNGILNYQNYWNNVSKLFFDPSG